MKRDLFQLCVVFGLIVSGYQAHAIENTSVTKEFSNRQSKKLGVYLGVLNEPAPSLLSVNVGYNLTDYARLVGGVGRMSMTSGMSMDGNGQMSTTEASVTTVGAGAKFMVPNWSLTPTAGIHFGSVFYSGTPGAIEVGGFESSGSHVYLSAGLDWQAKNGFNLGLGVNQSLRAGVGTSGYFNVGWFFDWLG